MKNNSRYIFIFINILFLSSIASATKVFKEDFNQEEGLIILNKLNNSFNDFEVSFNNYKKSNWEDQFNTLSISKNRIRVAFKSAELTRELEEKWDTKDKETISPRKIQKTTWENSKIHLIPYALTLFETNNPFGNDIQNLEEESQKILQKNSEELAKIMEEMGDREEKEEAKVYFKYKKLKEKKVEENSPNYFDDLDYQKYGSNQIDSLKKLKELASISNIENLPKVLNYNEVFNNLRDQKLPLFKELKNLQTLADEMVKIYFL